MQRTAERYLTRLTWRWGGAVALPLLGMRMRGSDAAFHHPTELYISTPW